MKSIYFCTYNGSQLLRLLWCFTISNCYSAIIDPNYTQESRFHAISLFSKFAQWWCLREKGGKRSKYAFIEIGAIEKKKMCGWSWRGREGSEVGFVARFLVQASSSYWVWARHNAPPNNDDVRITLGYGSYWVTVLLPKWIATLIYLDTCTFPVNIRTVSWKVKKSKTTNPLYIPPQTNGKLL